MNEQTDALYGPLPHVMTERPYTPTTPETLHEWSIRLSAALSILTQHLMCHLWLDFRLRLLTYWYTEL